jgi:hypothetical protein
MGFGRRYRTRMSRLASLGVTGNLNGKDPLSVNSFVNGTFKSDSSCAIVLRAINCDFVRTKHFRALLCRASRCTDF